MRRTSMMLALGSLAVGPMGCGGAPAQEIGDGATNTRAAAPVLDASPEKAPPPHACAGADAACPPEPPPTTTEPRSGKPPIVLPIVDLQREGDALKLVIGAGTSDGLADGMSGSIVGMNDASFILEGCSKATCRASVRGSIDEVRAAGNVVVRP